MVVNRTANNTTPRAARYITENSIGNLTNGDAICALATPTSYLGNSVCMLMGERSDMGLFRNEIIVCEEMDMSRGSAG